MINVTKTYLPPIEEYMSILKRAWDKEWITNNGELVLELEQKLKAELAVDHLFFCTNGTIVLQMALKAFNITKEVITTPFSYVATCNAILWEGCTPVFVDIDSNTLCIDATKIEEAITKNTEAILATHVYGFPCEIEAIEAIAKKHGLKVIYDGAHAFGCYYKGKPLLNYGDISTCSFHATKIFHTTEGGCIICHDKELANNLSLLRSFGHLYDEYFSVGINAKNSEMHAAMGLANLPKLQELIDARSNIFAMYDSLLSNEMNLIRYNAEDYTHNYSYYPVLFKSEAQLLFVKEVLAENAINIRRYFYPSLNQLPHTFKFNSDCPIAETVSTRVACLPLYHDLKIGDVRRIANIINSALELYKEQEITKLVSTD